MRFTDRLTSRSGGEDRSSARWRAGFTALLLLLPLAGARPAHALDCEAALSHVLGPAGTVHENVFESSALSSVSLQQKQKYVLKLLSGFPEDGESQGLIAQARVKLAEPGYSKLADSPGISELMGRQVSKLDPEAARRDALEFTIRTFLAATDGDLPLRLAAIDALGRSSAADLSSIEVLLPLARGFDTLGYPDFKEAETAIQLIGQSRGEKLPQFHLTARNWEHPWTSGTSGTSGTSVSAGAAGEPAPARDSLQNATIASVKPISAGNANSTLLVTLHASDGRLVSGVFKPATGEVGFGTDNPSAILFTREVQAYDLFHEYFAFRNVFVPETLEATVSYGGKAYGVGSFQLFADGKESVNDWYMKGHPVTSWQDYWKVWKLQSEDPRWNEPAPWIRVYDWVIGNQDRFPNSSFRAGNPNNILMSETNGPGSPLSIALIDNGNGRAPTLPGQYWTQDLPPVKELTQDMIDRIRSFDDAKDAEIEKRFAGSLSKDGLQALLQRIRALRSFVDPAGSGAGR